METFWKIYLKINFWILLWMLSSLVIWNLNVTVSITLKYCDKEALYKKLTWAREAVKYFPKKLLVHEILRPMGSWYTIVFSEKFVKPSAPSSRRLCMLNVSSLTFLIWAVWILFNFDLKQKNNFSLESDWKCSLHFLLGGIWFRYSEKNNFKIRKDLPFLK